MKDYSRKSINSWVRCSFQILAPPVTTGWLFKSFISWASSSSFSFFAKFIITFRVFFHLPCTQDLMKGHFSHSHHHFQHLYLFTFFCIHSADVGPSKHRLSHSYDAHWSWREERISQCHRACCFSSLLPNFSGAPKITWKFTILLQWFPAPVTTVGCYPKCSLLFWISHYCCFTYCIGRMEFLGRNSLTSCISTWKIISESPHLLLPQRNRWANTFCALDKNSFFFSFGIMIFILLFPI